MADWRRRSIGDGGLVATVCAATLRAVVASRWPSWATGIVDLFSSCNSQWIRGNAEEETSAAASSRAGSFGKAKLRHLRKLWVRASE